MLRKRLVGLRWVWLLTSALFYAFTVSGNPPTWAAPVLTTVNQTIPPFALHLHLPQIIDPPRLLNITNSLTYESRPAWSPDGLQLAFVRTDLSTGMDSLFLTNADGSQQELFVATGFDPAWSPDGGTVAFGSFRDGNNEIYIFDLASGELTNLTNRASEEVGPVWSPDGGKIAFRTVNYENFSDGDLYVMNADGSQNTQFASDVAFRVTNGPGWSPNGSKLAFIGCLSRNNAICVMNADGSNLVAIDVFSEYAGWSPDGSKIAFSSLSAIHIMQADGSQLTNLTSDFEIVVHSGPIWSSDGSQLLFTVSRSNPETDFPAPSSIYEIYVMNADGSQRRQLRGITDENPIYATGWSTDNKEILITTVGEIYSLEVGE